MWEHKFILNNVFIQGYIILTKIGLEEVELSKIMICDRNSP